MSDVHEYPTSAPPDARRRDPDASRLRAAVLEGHVDLCPGTPLLRRRCARRSPGRPRCSPTRSDPRTLAASASCCSVIELYTRSKQSCTRESDKRAHAGDRLRGRRVDAHRVGDVRLLVVEVRRRRARVLLVGLAEGQERPARLATLAAVASSAASEVWPRGAALPARRESRTARGRPFERSPGRTTPRQFRVAAAAMTIPLATIATTERPTDHDMPFTWARTAGATPTRRLPGRARRSGRIPASSRRSRSVARPTRTARSRWPTCDRSPSAPVSIERPS